MTVNGTVRYDAVIIIGLAEDILARVNSPRMAIKQLQQPELQCSRKEGACDFAYKYVQPSYTAYGVATKYG